jgi:dUTPase
LLIEAIILPEPIFVDDLEGTERGANGLGSTGN